MYQCISKNLLLQTSVITYNHYDEDDLATVGGITNYATNGIIMQMTNWPKLGEETGGKLVPILISFWMKTLKQHVPTEINYVLTYPSLSNKLAAKPYCFLRIFIPTRSYSILHVYLFWVKCPTYTFISSYTIIVFFCANIHTFINFEFLSNKSCNFHIFFERYSGKFKKLQKTFRKIGKFRKIWNIFGKNN